MNCTQLQRIIKYLIVGIILLSFYSCTEKASKQSETLENKMELVVYDSIDLPDLGLINISDYNANTNSFLGFLGNTIVEFNNNGHFSHMNKYGHGPEEYSFQDKYNVNVKYYNDTIICTNVYNYLKFFNKDGEIYKQFKIDDKEFDFKRKILGTRLHDTNKFVFNGFLEFDYDVFDEVTMYNRSNIYRFFTFSEKTKEIKQYGKFEKENLIRKRQKIYSSLNPKVVFNKKLDCIDILYSAEPKIFRYNLNTPDKITTVSLNPSYFSEMIFRTYDFYDSKYQKRDRRDFIRSSFYYDLYSAEDTVITIYRPGVDEATIDRELVDNPSNMDYHHFYVKNFNKYIDFYVNGKKQMSDIKLPHGYNPVYIGDSHHILLIKPSQEITKGNKAIRRFYFAKLLSEQS
ncbi:MAG: hypothetical protein ACEPOV_01210 [Hyphomicrobiales bacterium]